MVNNTRTIENIWNMLRFLYDELRGKKFDDIDVSNISDMDNLYAIIICRWCDVIAKEGLYKEYVEVVDEELTSPKGQINVQQSIVMQTRARGTLICSYDELSEDIFINHILKGILQYISIDSNVDGAVRLEAKKTLMQFNGVSYIDVNYIKWKDVKYNNGNIRYKHLLEMIKNLIYERKLVKEGILDDDKRMYLLFKKQIFKWVRLQYGVEDTVSVIEMPFNLEIDPMFEVKVNKRQKLISIRTDDSALVLCIRLQDEKVINDSTVGKRHLIELVGALREFHKEYKIKPSACLIYVNTDKSKLNLQPITINNVNDFMIGEQTIDIHDYWRFITNKLSDCYKYFILRGKAKKNINIKTAGGNKK